MMSSVMIAALMGTMYRTPISPRGINKLRAASGPYAAELRPSRPKIGIPCEMPTCSARSSEVLMGLPTSRSRMFMGGSARCGRFWSLHLYRDGEECQHPGERGYERVGDFSRFGIEFVD